MIYLDNAATTFRKPEAVYHAVDECLRGYCANPGRSGHMPAARASREVYRTRECIAGMFGIANPEQVIFTSNGTDALNLALHGVLRQGDHVVCTSMEHNSILRPLHALGEQGITHTVVDTGPSGLLDVGAVEQVFKKNTRLLAVTHASNLTGIVNPLKELGSLCHRRGVIFLVDAAQTAGVVRINVEEMNIGLLAAPGHKALFGIHGTGLLYVREDIELKELKQGGTGSYSSEPRQPDILPDRYESGTLNLPGIVALGWGVEFVRHTGIGAIQEKERRLTSLMMDGLLGIRGVTVYGDKEPCRRVPVISFNMRGYTSAEAAALLDERYQICVRPGLHCAPLAHRSLATGQAGAIRMSLSYFNTEEEVGQALDAVRELSDRHL
ncbi:aminotransferase class V-fold PLP-dependent enzyme [Enterocloster bolteae]|uniref:aminotransferase class V-fold PLP-dependent enzyme n=1 Tax=Enterocloster bolteae TaxID=208479 RepID=UPI00210BA42F|nr:aminotransferase class V-fold PLP-dependent enzyme [Enterocloster bolteae]MCQ5143080.1 aminotransferase class V-fold PLP-dependent enzyme [Enterocloster bolteae]